MILTREQTEVLGEKPVSLTVTNAKGTGLELNPGLRGAKPTD
jgi:hypothetical protein